MYKKFILIALVIISVSGCASSPQKAEIEFESLIQTKGYYYSEGNLTKIKILEDQLAAQNMSNELLKSMLGEIQYYVLTFDDLSSNRLTYITLSKPVVDGKIDEQSIKNKISSEYRISIDRNGGYKISFSGHSGALISNFFLQANKDGEIKNFIFISQ